MSDKRFCTMPNIPLFRDWYEKRFGKYCKEHDEDYDKGECKLCNDKKLAGYIWRDGYKTLSVLTFLAVNLPQVWYEFYKIKSKLIKGK